MHAIKKRLYFTVAHYFAFWARWVLFRWQPRIIVVTGSSGKTTLLHLIEAQLGEQARYSHHANSAIGIPFHILGLSPNVPTKSKWLVYFLVAPFCTFRRPPIQKLYVVEADTDRPGEGAFISRFLQPEVTMWVSVFRTHVMNFDAQVRSGRFTSPEAAIAYDFGNYAAAAKKLVLANGDQPDLMAELPRVPEGVALETFSLAAVTGYALGESETSFTFSGDTLTLPGLHPRQIGVSLQMVHALLDYLKIPERTYDSLILPPGRSSVFQGKKHTVIIDSTYNTGLGAMAAILELFASYAHEPKWVIMGDILEQGSREREEHENLARILAGYKFDRIILLGKRSKKYVLPLLEQELPTRSVVAFESPKEVLDYLTANLKGGEAMLFKGARGLEGVIEQLLEDPAEADKLVRRDAIWVRRRQAWGLPR